MREITLSGTFYEMGRQYGSLLRGKIKSFLFMTRLMAVASEGEGRDFFRPRYLHMLGGLFQRGKYKQTYRRVAEEFEVNIARYYPEILDMIKGIADAVGVDYRDLIFMNCRLEYSLKCALVHGSASVQHGPTPGQVQPTRWLSGIPRAVMVFKIQQPTLASTLCLCKVRLRIVRPMSDLYRYTAFSTRLRLL